MATRYSGNVTMRIQYMDHDGQYHIGVSWPGDRRRVIVGHPAHLTMAVDSPEAYDNAARAALTFVLDEIEGTKPDRGSIFVHYNNAGVAIARQRDPLAGTGRSGPMPQYRGLGSLVSLTDTPITPQDLSAAIRIPMYDARDVADWIIRAEKTGMDPAAALVSATTPIARHSLIFGVEAIQDPRRSFRGPHGQVVAYYINTGDPYTPHLLYDVDNRRYMLAAWGDWLEQYEQENGPIPG